MHTHATLTELAERSSTPTASARHTVPTLRAALAPHTHAHHRGARARSGPVDADCTALRTATVANVAVASRCAVVGEGARGYGDGTETGHGFSALPRITGARACLFCVLARLCVYAHSHMNLSKRVCESLRATVRVEFIVCAFHVVPTQVYSCMGGCTTLSIHNHAAGADTQRHTCAHSNEQHVRKTHSH